MNYLLNSDMADLVESVFEDDFVYLWTKGPCIHFYSEEGMLNPSSLFFACYIGLDTLKKYGGTKDHRALQKIKYLPDDLYDELCKENGSSEDDYLYYDIVLIVTTLCELLRLPQDKRLIEIADVLLEWIVTFLADFEDSFQQELKDWSNRISEEYRYKSPMTIAARRIEQGDTENYSNNDNIIAYIREYMQSERRISEEIAAVVRNEGKSGKVPAQIVTTTTEESKTLIRQAQEEIERLEQRTKELEKALAEKEKEAEALNNNGGVSKIRVADGKKRKMEVILCGLYYSDYFVDDKGVKLGRDETVQEIMKQGFQCEAGRVSKDISQFVKTGTLSAFKEDLLNDYRDALADIKKVQR